jgi:plastocyanin
MVQALPFFMLATALLLAGSFPQAAPAQTAISIDPATTGEIAGKVTFEGTKPKLAVIAMDKDPVCMAQHVAPVHVEDGAVNSDGTLPNVFVYVKQGAEQYSFPVPTIPVTLDQRGCMYRPHVLGIMVGQELRVVSSDPTTHNIHPMPKENREWNQSQPPGAAPLIKKFARPEVMIPVKCNQHPWMKAYIGVTSNPFYAVTGSGGVFEIKGLPPGNYTVEAWAPIFGAQERAVTVTVKKSTQLEFKFKAP